MPRKLHVATHGFGHSDERCKAVDEYGWLGCASRIVIQSKGGVLVVAAPQLRNRPPVCFLLLAWAKTLRAPGSEKLLGRKPY